MYGNLVEKMVSPPNHRFGTIIILNGTSSSGKTSILKALQKLMEEPYLDAGIDRFIFSMPRRYLDRPLWDDVLGLADRAGKEGHRLFHGMHHAIAALSHCGVNVVADHVLVEKNWLVECTSLFADLPAYLIGVQCPIAVLEQRERERKDRTFGQASLQLPLVHAHAVYDLSVDTSVLTAEECALQIRERVCSGPPGAFRKMKGLE
jgi:chloramphenicol 3-O phosphotransferase